MSAVYKEELLVIDKVSKQYGDNLILRDISHTVRDVFNGDEDQGQVIGLLARSGVGKALANGTPVITPSGPKPIESLMVGDYVLGSDGKSYPVTGVYPQGKKQLYIVEFIDGSSIECCEEHLWPVRIPHQRNKDNKNGTRTYTIKSLAYIRDNMRRWYYEIPLPKAVEFIKNDYLPLDPYLLGLLIGDGSFTRTCVLFSKPEDDVIESLKKLLPTGDSLNDISWKDFRIVGGTIGCKGTPSKTRQALIKLGLDGKSSLEKFIPESYLYAKYNDRLRLLRGLLDTDGHVFRGTGVEYSSSSKQLARDVELLARSLGAYVTRCKARIPTYSMKDGTKRKGALSYRIYITFQDGTIPVSSKKHLEKFNNPISVTRKTKRTIDKITKSRIAEATCISIDSPDNCYIAGDYIVTHNTSLFRMLAGLEETTSGTITYRSGDEMVPVHAGCMGIVTQKYTVFDHRTVYSNLLVAANRNPEIKDKEKAVKDSLEKYLLADKGKLYPEQLSGGQKQRVAIARAVLAGSKFLLMDEPFSGLDPIMIEKVCMVIKEIAAADGLATIFVVTHDVEAAVVVSDTLLCLGYDYEPDGKNLPGAYIKYN